MRTTPGNVARQLSKFWATPDRIDIGTAPRQWPQFWRRPDVVFVTAHRGDHSITLRPGRGPEQQRIPLSAWNRSYDPPGRSRPGQRDEPGSADRPERKKARRYG